MRYARTIALFLSLSTLWPISAGADGALAVGMSPNLGENGVVWGFSANWANADKARRAALQRCQEQAETDEMKQSCYVISDVYHGCIGSALAPDGHYGFGWGIAPNVQTAKYLAMEMCKSTAGVDAASCLDITDGNLFNVCDRSDNGRQLKDGNTVGGKALGRRTKP
jgi:hypothetical protein